MSMAGPLAGVGVLVTRPLEQSVVLHAQLHALGAAPLLFPALAMVGLALTESQHVHLMQIEHYDWVIFVSPNAVQFGLKQVPPDLRQRLKVAAVGNGTAAALRAAGCPNVLTPRTGAGSESLLALPELTQPLPERVLIVRGAGGHELIAETLRARGVIVDYIECYQRVCPPTNPTALRLALQENTLQAITVFSAETLDNLLVLTPPQVIDLIRALPLFVPHERIAQQAEAKKFSAVIVTEGGLLAGLVEYFQHD